MNSDVDLLLPKEQILHSSKDFLKLLKGGKRLGLDCFELIYGPNGLGYPRIGYIVSKKVSSKAVKRNRIKRIFREYFRHNKPLFGSNDIIFVCKKDISSWNLKMVGEAVGDSPDLH